MKHTTPPAPSGSIFQRPLWVSLFALTAAIAWGWAYPLIKIGFQEFQITSEMTGSKMLFAGIRFFFSGLIILLVAAYTRRSFRIHNHRAIPAEGWAYLLMFTLLNTTLHYTFFYIGLSHSPGARAAILNSMSVFTVVILAPLFFKSDRMTLRKLTGVLIGFIGILALNMDGLTHTTDTGLTWLGDGMIVGNALCSAFASLLTRGLTKRVDIFVGTGISLMLGGLLIVIPGLLLGGTLPHVTLWGLVILCLLISISSLGFTLYNKLITCNPIGKVAIYNSLIPVVGAITSCLFVGEPFYWKYVIAGLLATLGIYIINKR